MSAHAHPRLARHLSAEGTKARQLQDAVLKKYREHAEQGTVPTSARFIFYELEQDGVVKKKSKGERGRSDSQNVAVALLHLRQVGLVPWGDIVDGNRSVTIERGWSSVFAAAQGAAEQARLDPWRAAPERPVVICEAETAGVALANDRADCVAYMYGVNVAPVRGQSHGFLVNEVAPLFEEGNERAIYVGDLDFAGADIEASTRRILERHLGRTLEWERLAITQAQADDLRRRGVEPIQKIDGRHKGSGGAHEAYELEALGQLTIANLVRARLDQMLPESLDDVRVRETRERDQVQRLLEKRRR